MKSTTRGKGGVRTAAGQGAAVQRPAEGDLVGARLDARRRSFAALLLHQQLGCWGQDVRAAEGNVLLRHGFRRTPPPPEHAKCASLYEAPLPEGRRVALRGFGVFYGDDARGGIFVQRYGFSPSLTSGPCLEPTPWHPEESPAQRLPRTPRQRATAAALLADLVAWIADYEAWVRATLGPEHRRRTLEAWQSEASEADRRKLLPAEAMAPAWAELAAELRGRERSP